MAKKTISNAQLPTIRVPMDAEVKEIMENVVSVDGGNGKQAMYRLYGGKLQRSIVYHGITRIKGSQLNLEFSSQVRVPFADFMGDKWGYTDAIWELSSVSAETHQLNAARYGSQEQVMYALINAGELDIKTESALTAVVTVPPGMYTESRENIINGFMKGNTADNWWEISLSKDMAINGSIKPRRYKFKRVIVLMEGEAAWAGYRYDLNGNVVPIIGRDGQDALAGAIRIGDGGFGTYDEFVIRNGYIVAEGIGSATDTNGGIMARICEPLAEAIRERTGSPNISTAFADFILRRYCNGAANEKGEWHDAWSEGAATYAVNGYVLKMKDMITHLLEGYARWVIQNKIDVATAKTVMDGYMLVGGMWNMIGEHVITNRKKVFFIHPQMTQHAKSFSTFEMNAVGGLAYSAANFRAHVLNKKK